MPEIKDRAHPFGDVHLIGPGLQKTKLKRSARLSLYSTLTTVGASTLRSLRLPCKVWDSRRKTPPFTI